MRRSVALLTAIAAGACGHSATPAAPAKAAAPIAMTVLKNATYHLAFDPTRTMRLVNGAASDGSDLEGTMQLSTMLLDSIARGTLPDGRADAAVVLVTNAGGTGSFYDLAIMADSSGTPVNVASVGLGDRVIIKTMRLYGDSVAVTLVTQGPKDPMCCPTLDATRHFVLDGGRLIPTDHVTVADTK